jgi:hypothetical protein
MMFSKRSLEGYLLKDHRASGGGMFESATLTCSHCQRQVILNPDRSRSRGYCPKCDHYVCDDCEEVRVQTGVCYTFKQRMDDFEKSVLKGATNG